MNEQFQSIDEALRSARAECEEQLRSMQDRLMAAEMKAELCQERENEATAKCERYMRIAERLVTQFATVEAVFAEAKAMALTVPTPAAKTPIPPNVMDAGPAGMDEMDDKS